MRRTGRLLLPGTPVTNSTLPGRPPQPDPAVLLRKGLRGGEREHRRATEYENGEKDH
jgi:hypothetical protein